jgi:diguanylate cyclase (GGDEF)-like protein/PAS domain S-box-containing protein
MRAALETTADAALQEESVPVDEAERLVALHRLGLLDTPPSAAFDGVTRLAQAALQVPILCVSLVDQNRVWFKSRIGLGVRETPRRGSLCDHVVWAHEPLIVRDAAADARFANDPLVSGAQHVRSYIGIPLFTRDRQPMGTLCAMDTKVREFGEVEQVVLSEFAKIAEDLLSAKELAAKSDGVLQYAMEREKLFRDTFEQAPVGIIHTSLHGLILRMNQRACALLGYNPAELRELSIPSITHPEDLAHNIREFKRTLAGEIDSYRLEQRLLGKDKGYVRLALSVAIKRAPSRQPDYNIVTIEPISAAPAGTEVQAGVKASETAPQAGAGEEALREAQKLLEEREKSVAEARASVEAREKSLGEGRAAIEVREKALGEARSGIEVREKALADGRAAIEARDKSLREARSAVEAREKSLGEAQAAFEARQKSESQAAPKGREKALEKALSEAQAALKERDKGAGEKQAALESREKAAAERQAALESREKAAAERQAALDAREKAASEKQAAVEAREKTVGEKQAALDAREKLLAEAQAALKEREKSVSDAQASLKERDERSSDSETAQKERDKALTDAQQTARAAEDALRYSQEDLRGVQATLRDTQEALRDAQDLYREAQASLQATNAKLAQESANDALTVLPNRRTFSRRGEQAANAMRQSRKPYGLILLDVDNFKHVNDEHGHDVGDDVLRTLGNILSTQLRNSSDMAARLGGDEFAVLCFGDINEQTLHDVAERIHGQIGKAPLATPKGLLRFTSSFGLALSIADDSD